jgi:hypothetical protein
MVSIRKLTIGALLSVAAYALDNGFLNPAFGQVVNANDNLQVLWTPTPGVGNVNLILRQGYAESLKILYTIVSDTANSGTYTWAVPPTQSTNTDYTIEIQEVANTTNQNFSPYFTILGVGQGITSTSSSSADPTTTGTSLETKAATANSSSSATSSASGSSSATSPASGSTSAASASTSHGAAAGNAASAAVALGAAIGAIVLGSM